MEPYRQETGKVATLDRANVDTDQIIPKQFLKRIERSGFGRFLFYDWRFREDGSLDPGFELNRSRFRGATVLLTGSNFGCGSSREHAPWALLDYGFRTVIAPSFADIFYNNCFKNGMLPIRLPRRQVKDLFRLVRENPDYTLTVDLESCSLRDGLGLNLEFPVESFRRHCLLEGLDEIGLTLRHEDKISRYEAARSA